MLGEQTRAEGGAVQVPGVAVLQDESAAGSRPDAGHLVVMCECKLDDDIILRDRSGTLLMVFVAGALHRDGSGTRLGLRRRLFRLFLSLLLGEFLSPYPRVRHQLLHRLLARRVQTARQRLEPSRIRRLNHRDRLGEERERVDVVDG